MSKVDNDTKLTLGLIEDLLGREVTQAERALITISFKAGVQTGLEWEPDPQRDKNLQTYVQNPPLVQQYFKALI